MSIRANHVTMMRIFLLPIPVYLLLYGDNTSWWVAFFLFLFLGATDFIDGMLARLEGPTKLGSLLDPVADKIYISALVLSFSAVGILPGWVGSVLLSREFLITALRSSVAIRGQHIKTSNLAKLKTIFQMGGFGTIFFSIMIPEFVGMLLLILSIPFLILGIFYKIQKNKVIFWSFPVFFVLALIGMLSFFVSTKILIYCQVSIMILFTWGSALEYLVSSTKIFFKTGFFAGDWARFIWAITYGIFVLPLISYFPHMIIPLLVAISLEFCLGGVDNIVVAEKKIFNLWAFLFSSFAGLLFALAVNYSLFVATPTLPYYYALALALVSSLICGATFGRYANIFMREFS